MHYYYYNDGCVREGEREGRKETTDVPNSKYLHNTLALFKCSSADGQFARKVRKSGRFNEPGQ